MEPNRLPKTMPKRPKNCRPRPIEDKERNRLICYADNKRHAFGKWDDPVAWEKYNAFCEERKEVNNETPVVVPSSQSTSGEHPPDKVSNAPLGSSSKSPLVADLVAEFLDYAELKKDKWGIDFVPPRRVFRSRSRLFGI